MTLHISRLTIDNFRNFVHLELDPFPPSAVVVGENGIGKTNMLFALRLILDPSLPDARRHLRPEDISDQADTQLADGVEVRVSVELAGFDDDVGAKAELDGCYVSLEPYVARLTYLFRPLEHKAGDGDGDESERQLLTIDDYEWLIFGGDRETTDARRVRRAITFSVLPALRDAVGDLAVTNRSPLPELLDAVGPDASVLEDATEDIDAAMSALADDPALTELASDLSSRVLRMVGPQLDLVPTLGFASGRPEQLLRSIRLFVDEARSRTVADTSTGNANVVYLALLLERLALRRHTDRVVATLLGVEEPEAHLHPGLQRHLFGYLLRQASGLLLTTHSPHIAAVTPLQSIVLLVCDSMTDGTVARTSPTNLTEVEAYDLERYLDVTRAEILFARVIAFVEGAAEMYLLPALARAAGFDLDAYGIVVTSVSGTDFVPYRRLCAENGLSLRHIVITDGDRAVSRGYLGLDRTAGLVPSDPAKVLRDGVATLRALDEETDDDEEGGEEGLGETSRSNGPDLDVDEAGLVEIAAGCDVFVGADTLELDLAPLLQSEMSSAYAELHGGSIQKFTSALSRIAAGEPRDNDPRRVLRAIERIGKGRYSQRLAGHIAAWPAGELRQRVLGLAAEEVDKEDELADEILTASGEPSYLLRALDRLSRMVRDKALLPSEQDTSEAD